MKDLNVSFGSAGGIMSIKWPESNKELGTVSATKVPTLSLWCFAVNVSWIMHLILEATFQMRYWETEWSSEEKFKKQQALPSLFPPNQNKKPPNPRSRRWRDWFTRKDEKKEVCTAWLSNEKGQGKLACYK